MISSWMLRRHAAVLGELHRERALPLRHAAQVGRVAERLGQRHFGLRSWRCCPCISVETIMPRRLVEIRRPPGLGTASGTSISIFMIGSSSTGFVFRNVSRKQFRRRSGTPCPSCRLRGTSRRRASALRPTIGKPATGPLASDVAEALFDRRDVFFGNAAADDVRRRTRTVRPRLRLRGSGSSLPTMWAYWPEPPVCFLCLKSNSAVLVGDFAVADLRRADFDLDLYSRRIRST